MDNSDDYSGYGGSNNHDNIVGSLMHYDPSGYTPYDFSQGYPPAPSYKQTKTKKPREQAAKRQPAAPSTKPPRHAPVYYDRPPPPHHQYSDDSDSDSSDSSSSSAGGQGPPPTTSKRGTKKQTKAYLNQMVGKVSGGNFAPGPPRGPKAKRAPSARNAAVSAYMRKNGGSLGEASRAVAAAARR